MAELNLAAFDAATTKLGVNVGAVSTAVDDVSIRFAALSATISTSMTAEQVAAAQGLLDTGTTKLDAVVTGLDAIKVALDAIGASPTTPIPELPPPPDPIITDPLPPAELSRRR